MCVWACMRVCVKVSAFICVCICTCIHVYLCACVLTLVYALDAIVAEVEVLEVFGKQEVSGRQVLYPVP